MVHLDRENRVILLPDDSVVPYDVLVLGTGVQVHQISSTSLRRDGHALEFFASSLPGASLPLTNSHLLLSSNHEKSTEVCALAYS